MSEAIDLKPLKDGNFYRCADDTEKWCIVELSPGVALLLCKFCYAAIQLRILDDLKKITVK